jgi:hypothetical protein
LRSLHDFEPLLPAERVVLRAAATADIAKVGYRRANLAFSESQVRAEFVRFLACGGDAQAPVAGRRLQIMGASIVGRLDLQATRVPMSLWLYRCSLSHSAVLDGAHVAGSVSFSDCAMPGLHAQACRIETDLDISAGCDVHGEVLLSRARIGRDLNFTRLRLRAIGQEDAAVRRLVLERIVVGGDVILDGGLQAMGEVRMGRCRIGGDLRAGAAHLVADVDAQGARGVALDLDRALIGGSVLLDTGFSAAGQVRMRQARVGGSVDCDGAAFDAVGDAGWGDHGASLQLDRTRVGGALVLCRLQGPLQGASLTDTRVGELVDDATTWGMHHELNGLRYGRLGASSPTDPQTRLEWLHGQRRSQFGSGLRPQPWRQLIAVLRHMGHEASAADVAIDLERQRRRAGLIGAGRPAGARRLAEAVHDAFGGLCGYGHRPLRLVAWAAVVWLACGTAYWSTADDGSAPLGCTAPAAPPPEPAKAALQAYARSLEVLVPLLRLQHTEPAAAPCVAGASALDDRDGGAWLRVLGWAEGLCGWVLGLALLASVGGWGRRDRMS